MRVDVFQAVAISVHGNAFLNGEEGSRAPDLFGPSPLFKNVTEMVFNRVAALPIVSGPVASGTKNWFLRLKREGVEELRLALDLCNRTGTAKEPAGWGIVASGDSGTEIWQPIWKGLLVGYSEPAAYKLAYQSAKHSPWALRRPEPSMTSLARLRSLIHESLQACISLGHSSLFREVKQAWNGEGPSVRITEEILPEGVSEDFRTLVLTAVQAVIMVDGENWKIALEADGEDGVLTVLSNRLWSAAMRAFESTATVGAVRQANSSPGSPISPESFLV
jgi:hypothetical protein